MTNYFYQGLTTNLEIGNTPVWILPNIWRLGWVRDTKSGTDVSKEMLLNAENRGVTTSTVPELLREKQQEGAGKITPLLTQIRVNNEELV